ncbi:universal stress protein [Paraglaciecola sp. 25GB23A]|uniref:universal stress protein n=1 Tax=Paraglaciecola sp. 25GB23A TaxID=3156068 RepID=UPI0032AF222C
MNKIIACIDGSVVTSAICEAAAWSAKRLNKPILFLHTIERPQQHGADDLSGAIGLGARSKLLAEMAALDEQRGKLALSHGKEMLAAAADHVSRLGIVDIEQKQRHGDVIDAIAELEDDARLMIVGRDGEGHDAKQNKAKFKILGSHIESLLRTVHTPLFVVPSTFKQPQNFMLAYDGRATADKAIDKIICGGLLNGLECHLVMVRNNESAQAEKLAAAESRLKEQGFKVTASLLEGNIFDSLQNYQQQNAIDLLVMGAFAHSKIRQLFLGSNTIGMIERSVSPLIVLR